MRAWVVRHPGSVDGAPLALIERTAPRAPNVVPGHEIVGRVDALGEETSRFAIGDRVGIAWLRHTCGACAYCERGDENLCGDARFTRWDTDGGYAEHAVVDERFAYRLPDVFGDDEAAPLLCAGIIGFRALRRAALPRAGRLGIYGFGGSAHLAAQVALAEGATVHVLTRNPEARHLALELGAASVGDTTDPPPEPFDSAIVFARSSRSDTCAASPPTPAPTVRSSSPSPPASVCALRHRRTRWITPTPLYATSPTAASRARPSCASQSDGPQLPQRPASNRWRLSGDPLIVHGPLRHRC
jgi:hypothetical protein